MAKINLTDEKKLRPIEAMNNGTELTPDLLPKLFPGTAEKFDVKALDPRQDPDTETRRQTLQGGDSGRRRSRHRRAELLQIVRCFGKPEGLSAYSRG